jgi:hypothetical protein
MNEGTSTKKVLRFLLPSPELEDITNYVIRYYAKLWRVKFDDLKNSITQQLDTFPYTITKQFQKTEGEFYFLVDHEKSELNIRFYFQSAGMLDIAKPIRKNSTAEVEY